MSARPRNTIGADPLGAPDGPSCALHLGMQPMTAGPQLTLAEGVTRDYLIHHRVCPVRIDAPGHLILAAAPDAFLDDAVDDLGVAYKCRVSIEESTQDDVERLIERLTTASDRMVELERVDGGIAPDEDFTADVRDLANQPPVVRYVYLLVRDAHDAGASDIHLEATRSGL